MAPLGHTETVSLSSTFSLSSYLWSSDLLTKCSFWQFPPLASTSKASQFFAGQIKKPKKQLVRFMCTLEKYETTLPGINVGSLIGTWLALLKKLYMPHNIQPRNDLWAPIKLSPFLVGSCHGVVWSAIKIFMLLVYIIFFFFVKWTDLWLSIELLILEVHFEFFLLIIWYRGK